MNGNVRDAQQIKSQLDAILHNGSAEDSVAYLTTADRDSWAKTRYLPSTVAYEWAATVVDTRRRRVKSGLRRNIDFSEYHEFTKNILKFAGVTL